jgi:SecD/SecF fusion protein
MKNKGTIIGFTVVLAIVCIYQLSFTWVTRKIEKKADEFAMIDGKIDQSLKKRYLDSIADQKAYDLFLANYTYAECKQKELNLGLDLRGGMNVVLEISTEDVIKGLAGPNAKDQDLEKALKEARLKSGQSEGVFLDFFVESFKANAPNRTLAPLFATRENSDFVNFNSTDKDVVDFLRTEIADASSRAFEVIETRVSQSNVSQPNIQRLDGGRISVELPGVENPDQIRRLLQESAKLEFWEVYGNNAKNNFAAFKMLEEANNALAIKYGGKKASEDSLKSDTDTGLLALDGTEIQEEDDTKGDLAGTLDAPATLDGGDDSTDLDTSDQMAKFRNDNPLFTILYPSIDNQGQVLEGSFAGYALKKDMERVEQMLDDPVVRKLWPRNVRIAWGAQPLGDGGSVYALYLLKANKQGNASLSGDIVVDARPSLGQTGKVEISMKMNDIGAREWKLITKNNINEFIAIALDGKVYSAPVVNSEIPNGMSSISGSFDTKEAEYLSNILKAGRLPAPARIVAEDVVGPTLGVESIQKGTMALIVGFLSVLMIMFVYYARGGFAATVAVLLNMFFIIGILASQGAALTLPGIAGLVLTIGMAVDANVLIFERIKEELLSGKALKAAITAGYKGAMSSIVDANITTLLAGIIMTFAGAGPVYGFAIILIIGILSSLYTAILITRLIIERRVDSGKDFKFGFSYSNLGQNSNFDFMRHRKKFYIISSVIILGGILSIFTSGLPVGIDFKGGWSYRVQLEQSVPSFELKTALDKTLEGSSNEVKTIGSDNRYKIVTTYLIESQDKEAGQNVEAALLAALQDYGVTKESILSSTKVGPTVASSIRYKSTVIIILSIIVMFFYIVIRFKKFSFGMGAAVAILHDVLMVFSIYAIIGRMLPFSTELDQTFIAAMLTIVGYSINDTVVVFDRIREFLNERRTGEGKLSIFNSAINRTLSRTIMTSSTTLFVILILFIFGGEALKSFSFALLVGILVGTYSSIFIASPIVVDMMPKDLQEKN